MSGGHASHKSTSAKPNPNAATGSNDLDPIDTQPEEGYPFTADEETETTPEATQRGKHPAADQK